MIVAIDVHYRATFAKAVSIEFDDWKAVQSTTINTVLINDVAPYLSGQFYKRELPCILEVLKQMDTTSIETIIIDGYVVLDDSGKHGLGMYLYEHLNQSIPIIGVAKRAFKDNEINVRKVIRGKSKQPLFVTSVGIELGEAAQRILEMNGEFRIPTLLKLLDNHTKN